MQTPYKMLLCGEPLSGSHSDACGSSSKAIAKEREARSAFPHWASVRNEMTVMNEKTPAKNGGNGRYQLVVLLVLLASIAIMVMYVEAMAFPSLPMVMADFSLTPQDYSLASWIITIYLIVGAVAIPIFGKLGDIYGKKKMLLIAMTIYTVAVTLTGFSRDISDSIYVMIGFRAVQGLGCPCSRWRSRSSGTSSRSRRSPSPRASYPPCSAWAPLSGSWWAGT